MKKLLKIFVLVGLCFFVLMGSHSVLAISLTIDEIVYQPTSGLDPSKLSGSAGAIYSGGVLTITLTNTSLDLGDIDNDASALLAGIGFNLPTGVSITAGNVAVAGGSSIVNTPGSYDLQTEWGWGAGGSPFQTGHFVTGTIGFNASTLQSSINYDFTETAQPPANVDGPGWGLLSENQTIFSGLTAIEDSVVIALTLTGWTGTDPDLLAYIESHDVAIAFGSPTATSVPEPTTLLFLGFGLIGLWGFRRKFKK